MADAPAEVRPGSDTAATFKRALGPFDATMVVVGGIIGAGIFINPYLVARTLDSPALVLAAWAAGGAIALIGAFAYAELGSRLPRAGGQYVYLGQAWHPLIGFLYGWALLLLIETGAMAAVAIIFAEYTLRLVGVTGASPQPIAVAALVLVSIVNYLGVTVGSRVLNVLVVLKVAALVALILLAWMAPASPGWLTTGRDDDTPTGLMTFGAALIPILFAYGGWQTANYLAEEMRDPRRHLPRSLILGTLVVIAVYVLVNVAYLRVLGLEGLAATTTPAADAAAGWLGAAGERFVAAAIAISTFGFLNHAVLAPTRVYYAMAADGTFPPALARLHRRYRTPGAAIVVQSVWAIALALTGTYGDLLGTVVFADWIFFGLSVAALFVLRARQPGHSGYRMPGYPWLPGLFVAVAVVVVASSVQAEPVRSAVGAGLLLAGCPVYYWFTRRSQRIA
ncbi:MAG TPA: amino acid permease [Vicinamibacterales bacterium]|nr:amino acid permease [Vicinamibacterales bacterium]